MSSTVGVRELRQNLSRYLTRVKAGESLVVTERGREVARMIPSGPSADEYAALASRYGATVPHGSVEEIAAGLETAGALAGTTDEQLAHGRRDRA